jgi:Predicted pPIWI-associating nuclease
MTGELAVRLAAGRSVARRLRCTVGRQEVSVLLARRGLRVQDGEDVTNGRGDDLPASTDERPVEAVGFESYLQAQLGEGALGATVKNLSETLEKAAPLLASVSRFNEIFAHWDEQQRRMAAIAGSMRSVLPSPERTAFLASVTKDLRALDRATANSRWLLQQSAVADWSALTFGSSALTSWRMALEVESRVAPIAAAVAGAQFSQARLIENLVRVTRAQVRFTDWVVQHDATSRLLGDISGKPFRLWRTYVDSLPQVPDVDVLLTSVTTGGAVLGLLGADVLESDVDDAEFVDLAVERVESDVLAPSQQGRLQAANDLYARLGAIDATVPELLEGAWDDLERNGPAAASKAAHCLVEVLDRTLRAAAPENAVREWHTATGRPAGEFGDRARVTRPLRVRYIAREAGGAKKLVIAQYDSLIGLLTPLHGRLEGIKHASTADVTMVRTLLLTVESFLAVLFLGI